MALLREVEQSFNEYGTAKSWRANRSGSEANVTET